MAPGTLPAMKPATAEAGEPPGLVEERGRMALRKERTGSWEFLLLPSAPPVALSLRVAAQMRPLKAIFFSPVGHQCFWSCRARVLDSLDTEF